MIHSIQLLRGLSALLIVYSHAHGLIRKRYAELGLENEFWIIEQGYSKFGGALGVDLFLILAGFIIFYTYWNRDSTRIDFLKKRFIRIYPVWWCSVFGMIVLAMMPGTTVSLKFDEILMSLALIPYYNDRGEIKPVMEIGWTLLFIVYYYFLFAIFLSKSTLRTLIYITLLMTASIIMGAIVKIENPLYELMTNMRTLSFAAGGWIAYLARTRSLSFSWPTNSFLVILAIALSALYIWNNEWRLGAPTILSRAPIALIILMLVMFNSSLRRLELPRPLIIIGDASYSIYIFHMFPLMILSGLWKRGLILPPDGVPGGVIWAAIIVMGSLFGIAMYFLCEHPMVVKLNKLIFRRKESEKTLIQSPSSA